MEKLELAQFSLSDVQSSEMQATAVSKRIQRTIVKTQEFFFEPVIRELADLRNDSIAVLEFFFERQTGFFMLQIYTPLMLIVVCSWVTFWLVKTEKGGEVPARTVLGANAVLSVVNIGFGGEARPQVRNCYVQYSKFYSSCY